MAMTIAGVVRNGVVIPKDPLPEGAQVEIHVLEEVAVPPELQDELAAWQRSSANSLTLVERMAEEGQANEER